MRIVRADMGHVWEHVEARRWRPGAEEYRLLVGEVLLGRAWAAVDDDGVAFALAGIMADPGRRGNAWFCVLPGRGGAILPLAVKMRRAIMVFADAWPHGLACTVLDGNDAGARLCRALGFRPTGQSVFGVEQWEWHGRERDERDRRDDHGRAGEEVGQAGRTGAS